jgi:methionyl-tRNA formyltransferase
MVKKNRILLLTNKDSKNKILKILKNNFKHSKITTKIFSKPGLSTSLQFKKKYFDYIFSFRSFLILNFKMLNMAKLACINFHPAPPKYRGRGGINYALYKNEKKFGVTAHIIDKQIDHGKIISVKYFKIPKNCSVEKLFILTHKNLYIIANTIFKKLKNNTKSLNNMIEKNKNFKWSKKIFNTKDMNKFYKLNVNSAKKEFVKKIKATNYKNYKPYLQVHGFKFYLN